MTLPPDVRRARTAFWWVGVILPLAALLLSAVAVIAWMPQLPDSVGIHWSGGSGPDGFAPKGMLLLTPLIGAAMVVLFTVLALFAHRLPSSSPAPAMQWSPTARFLGATNLGLGVFMGLLTVLTSGVQRGLADAADAPDITLWTFVGFGVLVIVAVIGWFLQPRVDAPAASAAQADAVELAAGERAAWFGTVSIARSGRIALGALFLVMLAMAVFLFATDEPAEAAWILLATNALVAVITASMLVFRVRVSAAGLRVQSAVGWPRTHIELDDIENVQVVDVNPFGEFGGWGWRIGTDGRRGVVLRAGKGLQITHRGGRVFVVTVDGASDAAAVLEGLRRRAAHR